mgnify:CR=1 FL=1
MSDDPDDPSRKLIRQVLGAVAEYERSIIALRLRSGRKRKAKDGGYAYGAPPFGFRVEDGELVADQGEQETLGRARELQGGGASIREIAATLTSEGRRTKRGGTRWHPTTVARVAQAAGRLNRGAQQPDRASRWARVGFDRVGLPDHLRHFVGTLAAQLVDDRAERASLERLTVVSVRPPDGGPGHRTLAGAPLTSAVPARPSPRRGTPDARRDPPPRTSPAGDAARL